MTAKKTPTTSKHAAKNEKAYQAAVDTPIVASPQAPPAPAATPAPAAAGSAPAPTPAPAAGSASTSTQGETSTAQGTDPSTAAPGTDWTNPSEARFVDLSLTDFQNVVTQVGTHVDAITALLVNPTSLTPDQRKHSGGRLKDGEGAMLQTVLGVARKYPANFTSLADLDQGDDPSTFEVDLVSDRLAKAALLAPLTEKLTTLEKQFSDCTLEMNQGGAQPAREVYVLAKAMAKTNPIVSSMIAPVLAFYSAISQAAAATRKANEAAKAAAATTAAPAATTTAKA